MPGDKDFQLDDDLDSFSFEEDNFDLDSLDLGSLDEPPSSGATASSEPEIQEPFGVWVKTGPEEVQTDEPGPQEEDSLEDQADALSLDELSSLTDNVELVPISGSPELGETLEDDDFSTPAEASGPSEESDSFDDISLDDFVTFETDDDVAIPAGPSNQSVPSNISTEEEVNEEYLDIDIDIEDEIGDDELEIVEGAKVVRDEPSLNAEVTGATTVDLSEFGDFSLDDVKDDAAPEGSAPEDEGTFEETIMPDAQEDFSTGFEEVLSREQGTDLDFSTGIVEPDLGHITALEEDLTAGIKAPQEPAGKPDSGALASDQVSQILLKIERELSSIKGEISELKNEVTQIKTAADAAPDTESSESGKEKHSTGFFDEDEDETIALTGDELDNILSSASVKEEPDAAGADTSFDLSLGDGDLIQTDSEGNIQDESPVTTDEDLLSGTELEDSLEEGLGVPESTLNLPLPGSPEPDLDLDLGASSIPDEISLETEDTQNLLGDSDLDLMGSEPLGQDLTAEDTAAQDLSIELDEAFGEVPEEEIHEPLEIPFDPDLKMEDEEPQGSSAFEAPQAAVSFQEPQMVSAPAEPEQTDATSGAISGIPDNLRGEIKSVLSYMDKLLASLPDEKIQEFAESEHFETYKKLFEQLGLIE